MKKLLLSKQDLEQIEKKAFSRDRILRQWEILRRGQSYCRLVRPATIKDGIHQFSKTENETFISTFEKSKNNIKLMKFLPASGAATRMFEIPLQLLNHPEKSPSDQLFLVEFIKGLKSKRFAFGHELEKAMKRDHHSLNTIINRQRIEVIFEYLLTPIGLNYANLPKALIQFHSYGSQNRTPLEEHLVESGEYLKNDKGRIRIHITISEEFLKQVRNYANSILHQYENKNRKYIINFSVQKPSTHTIAVDERNQLLRDKHKKIIFRPGGHGALIENLNHVDADLIFISNIDNVFPDHLKVEVVYYKKVLAGFLLFIQKQIFGYLDLLSNTARDAKKLNEIEKFCLEQLNISFHKGFRTWSSIKRRDYIFAKLNRPIRICGMVRIPGEPGGGPFWVRDKFNHVSLQIVEKAQIDVSSSEQQAILSASTHFNPVDLVCGIKNFKGEKFNLGDFIDPEAYFISEKSIEGNPIKVLELPGLWNGAMAKWNTLFVEVPTTTFNPVKTINDLLRKEHQTVDSQ